MAHIAHRMHVRKRRVDCGHSAKAGDKGPMV